MSRCEVPESAQAFVPQRQLGGLRDHRIFCRIRVRRSGPETEGELTGHILETHSEPISSGGFGTHAALGLTGAADKKNNWKPAATGEDKMITKDNKKKPNPIDIHVGSRIRLRRNMLGMSQEKLGENLGITFQQIQKYEKGTNRVGASRLQAIATILNVPLAFFFEDAAGTSGGRVRAGLAEDASTMSAMDFLTSAEGLQLNRAFVRIADPKVRRRIIDLVKAWALTPID